MHIDIRTKKTVEEGVLNREIIQGTEVLVYAPGNGSVYVVSFTSLTGLSPVVKDRFGLAPESNGWLVTHVGYSPMPSMVVVDNQGGLLHWDYVREKLKVAVADALVLAELIGFVTGRTYVSCEEFIADTSPCCERDHNNDGNCDRHPGSEAPNQ